MLRFLYAFSERKVIVVHCEKQTGTNQWLFLMISSDSHREQEEGLFKFHPIFLKGTLKTIHLNSYSYKQTCPRCMSGPF